MKGGMNKSELERAQALIKADAIKYSILGVLFPICSLLSLDFKIFLFNTIFYLPSIIAAILGFICSTTRRKLYLTCYGWFVLIVAIYSALNALRIYQDYIENLTNILNDGCWTENDDICGLKAWLHVIVIIILEIILILNCALSFFAMMHSDRAKGLLYREINENQVPLLNQQGVSGVNSA